MSRSSFLSVLDTLSPKNARKSIPTSYDALREGILLSVLCVWMLFGPLQAIPESKLYSSHNVKLSASDRWVRQQITLLESNEKFLNLYHHWNKSFELLNSYWITILM